MTDMKEIARASVLQLLRGYKWLISPMLPPACRYVPSCSEYAMEAVDRHGVVRGGGMAIWRVLRCHHFAKGGYDPVMKVDKAELRSAGQPRTAVPTYESGT